MVQRQGNGEARPPCHGDNAEYSETSSYCRACSWSRTCKEKIDQSINTQSVREASYMSNWRSPRPVSPTTRNPQTLKVPAGGASNALIRPVKFNHEKPLAAQYVTYVMYDAAESMAVRAADLIRSCREEYEADLLSGGED